MQVAAATPPSLPSLLRADRRQHHGASQSADFFDPSNTAGEVARREVAKLACEEMCAALASDATDIAIFDATNTTVERRRWLKEVLVEQEAATKVRFQLVFIESVCGDERVSTCRFLLREHLRAHRCVRVCAHPLALTPQFNPTYAKSSCKCPITVAWRKKWPFMTSYGAVSWWRSVA